MSGPDVWGPHGWKFIHFITLGYPMKPSNEIKKQYFDFFSCLSNVIPCKICEKHFKEHIKLYPLTDEILSNKLLFIKWGIDMHNLVNQSNNKKMFSFNEGYKHILNDNKEKCSIEHFGNNKVYFLILFPIILLICILMIYIKVYRK